MTKSSTASKASKTPKIEWRVEGTSVGSCNCAWGCPCQFGALPTTGFCETMWAIDIEHGHFGETSLDGVRCVQVYHWDGPVHEGNGWRRLILDERSTPAQRAAIEALTSGAHGHAGFEIYSSMAPNALTPVVAPIELEHNFEQRRARIRIPGLAECQIEPIRNSVTGAEQRARIDLPDGFEFHVAEMADSVRWWTDAGEHLAMAHEHTYGEFFRIAWDSDGTVG